MSSEPETCAPELLVEEDPRYLRRPKPLEVRRRRFGRRSWQQFRRATVGGLAVVAGAGLVYAAAHLLFFSPRLALLHPSQIELSGTRDFARAAVIEKFLPDRGRSVLRIPLDDRRKALEEIAWVEQAVVERVLPNRVRVEIVERTPVAFLRLGADLALVDAHGVILERPPDAQLHFPVVTGISGTMPPEARQRRMHLLVAFIKDLEMVRPGAADHVSEVDISDEKDLRATLAGLARLLPGVNDQDTVLVHFGNDDFAGRFRLLVENMGQWSASAGQVDSVDLRFVRQVIVNPETKMSAAADSAARADTAGKIR